MTMSDTLKTLSRNKIEYTRNGVLIGEAYRTGPGQDWFIGVLINNGMVTVQGKMNVVARVEGSAPELVQRKAVFGILKGLLS